MKANAAHILFVLCTLQAFICIVSANHFDGNQEETSNILNHIQLDDRLWNILHRSPVWNHLLLDQKTKQGNSEYLENFRSQDTLGQDTSTASVTAYDSIKYEDPYTTYLRRVFGSTPAVENTNNDGISDDQPEVSSSEVSSSEVSTSEVSTLVKMNSPDKYGAHVIDVLGAQKRNTQQDKAEETVKDEVDQTLALQHNFNLMQSIGKLFGIEVVEQTVYLKESHNKTTAGWKDDNSKQSGPTGGVKQRVMVHLKHHEGFVANGVQTTTQTSMEKRVIKTVANRNQLKTLFRWG